MQLHHLNLSYIIIGEKLLCKISQYEVLKKEEDKFVI